MTRWQITRWDYPFPERRLATALISTSSLKSGTYRYWRIGPLEIRRWR